MQTGVQLVQYLQQCVLSDLQLVDEDGYLNVDTYKEMIEKVGYVETVIHIQLRYSS